MSAVTAITNNEMVAFGAEQKKTELNGTMAVSLQILTWPGWWYTKGLAWLFRQLKIFIRNKSKSLNIAVWVKYLFVPMFGTTDFASRIISVGVRLGQILLRTIALLALLVLVVGVVIIWITMPFIILLLMFRQIFGI